MADVKFGQLIFHPMKRMFRYLTLSHEFICRNSNRPTQRMANDQSTQIERKEEKKNEQPKQDMYY